MKVQIGGLLTPGTIPKGGMRGFTRDSGFDAKKGKGSVGAVLTLTGQPPVKGSITCQLFTKQDFADWDSMVSKVLAIPVGLQQTKGIGVYYPGWSAIGLYSVVVEKYAGPIDMGKGLYHCLIDLLEWNQPPPISNVKTVSTQTPDVPPNQILPPDPVSIANQAEIARLRAAGANVPTL
jgi:hypothetical protein